MSGQEHRNLRLGFWTVLLLSVFAWAPTTYPGYWESIEGFRPVFNALHSSAIAGVATQADFWRGTGGAAFLITQPLMLLGLTPVAAVRVTFAIALVLGGLGMYVWLRDRWGDRAAGLAGMLYMLWPPLLATVYIRGSLSDAMILALLPMAFAGVAVFSEQRSPSAVAVIALSILWMWRTQAGLAAAATLLLLAYALIVERDRLASIAVALSAAAGFTSLLPLWSIQAESPIRFFEHFVYPHQLLFGKWLVSPSEAGWQDQYPFQLGIAVVAMAIVGLWLWLVQRQAWRGTLLARSLAFCSVVSLIIITLSLPVSEPFWKLTVTHRLFTYPWQTLLLAGPLLALVAGSLPMTLPDAGKPVLWTVLVGLVVLLSLPYLTTEFTQVEPPEAPLAVYGESSDIVLLDGEVTEDALEQTAVLAVTWQVLQPLTFDYNVFFQAIETSQDGQEVLAQVDLQPLQGERPATTWMPGDIFTDTYTLDLGPTNLSDKAEERDLRYYFGYYDWRDGTRLPVDGGIDDKMIFYGE